MCEFGRIELSLLSRWSWSRWWRWSSSWRAIEVTHIAAKKMPDPTISSLRSFFEQCERVLLRDWGSVRRSLRRALAPQSNALPSDDSRHNQCDSFPNAVADNEEVSPGMKDGGK